MNIKNTIEKIKEHIKTLKKQGFSTDLMRKRSLSTLEKVILYFLIGIIGIVATVILIILPKTEELNQAKEDIRQTIIEIYGEEYGKEGETYRNDKIQKDLINKEKKAKELKEEEINKLDKALPKNEEIYNIATFLEDYTVTLSTKEKPIILNNVSFGKIADVNIPVNNLKQTVPIFIDSETVVEIFGEDRSTWPPEFFESTEGEFLKFRDSINQNSFQIIEDNKKRGALKKAWLSAPKITIPANYRFIPVTLQLESHEEKFEQFIDFIYHSGDIYNYYFKGNPVPVMSVESLSLPVEEIEEKDKDDITDSYSLKINVYFQKAEKLEKLDNKK